MKKVTKFSKKVEVHGWKPLKDTFISCYNCSLETVIRNSSDWEWIENIAGFCLIYFARHRATHLNTHVYSGENVLKDTSQE